MELKEGEAGGEGEAGVEGVQVRGEADLPTVLDFEGTSRRNTEICLLLLYLHVYVQLDSPGNKSHHVGTSAGGLKGVGGWGTLGLYTVSFCGGGGVEAASVSG